VCRSRRKRKLGHIITWLTKSSHSGRQGNPHLCENVMLITALKKCFKNWRCRLLYVLLFFPIYVKISFFLLKALKGTHKNSFVKWCRQLYSSCRRPNEGNLEQVVLLLKMVLYVFSILVSRIFSCKTSSSTIMIRACTMWRFSLPLTFRPAANSPGTMDIHSTRQKKPWSVFVEAQIVLASYCKTHPFSCQRVRACSYTSVLEFNTGLCS